MNNSKTKKDKSQIYLMSNIVMIMGGITGLISLMFSNVIGVIITGVVIGIVSAYCENKIIN